MTRRYAASVATLEDKVVQRAVVGVLNAVYGRASGAFLTGSGRGAARTGRWTRWRPGSWRRE